MRKAPVGPERFFLYAPRPLLASDLVGDEEEHWLEVNARPKEKPQRSTEESGSRWWE